MDALNVIVNKLDYSILLKESALLQKKKLKKLPQVSSQKLFQIACLSLMQLHIFAIKLILELKTILNTIINVSKITLIMNNVVKLSVTNIN